MLPHHFSEKFRSSKRLVQAFALCSGALVLPSEIYALTVHVFEKIEVRGAEFIPEDDIQMTCGAVEGVPYLAIELRAIEDCLMSTGVFETVTLIPVDDVLVISVQEIDTSPGRFEASLSYDSQDGVVGGVFYEQYNLFPDTYGSVQLSYNSDVQRATARLFKVDAIGEGIALGVNVGWEERYFSDRSYASDIQQIETYLAWTMGQGTDLKMGLGYRNYSLFDVADTAGELVKTEETTGISGPFLHFGLAKTSLSETQTGWGDWAYGFGMEQYFWNLGSGETLSDFRFESQSYVPLSSTWRVLISLDAGAISGLDGNPTRVLDRTALGANRFRGFAPRGVGPQENGTALGGNKFAVSSIELQHNFENTIEAPLTGGLFFESGAAWGLDETLGDTIDDGFYRRSTVGLSLSFDVGTSPVSLYLATPLSKQNGDEEQVFGINFSSSF